MTVVDPVPDAGPWTSEHPSQPIPILRPDWPAGELALSEDPSGCRHLRVWMLVPLVDFALILMPLLWRPMQPHAVAMLAVLGTLLLDGGRKYRGRLHLSVLDELPTILARTLTAVAMVAAAMLYLHQKEAVIVFLETACQSAALLVGGRVLTTRLIAFARRRGLSRSRTVLVGGGVLAAEIAKIVDQHAVYGLTVLGFVDRGERFPAEAAVPRLGRLEDLDLVLAATGASTLLVADGNFNEQDVMDAVRTEVCQSADLLVVPRMHHFHTQTGSADHIGSIPIMRVQGANLHGPAQLIKRLFDIVFATTALIVLSPLLLTAALFVRLESGPGVIFRQTRVGRGGKEFVLLKFRSMRPVSEEESQTKWCVAADIRVGPVGRLLRCTSIDELPQLWNIIRGDMTLVGPRPERPHFVELFSAEYDRYAQRHRVQAGLTGFAQVSGLRGDTSIADRARHDNFYIENWSLWLDVKIVLRTFREVVYHCGR